MPLLSADRPAAHASHAVALADSVKRPVGQSVHAVDAGDAEKRPGAQGNATRRGVRPGSKKPFGTESQTSACGLGWTKPGEHGAHQVPVGAGWRAEPAAHGWHCPSDTPKPPVQEVSMAITPLPAQAAIAAPSLERTATPCGLRHCVLVASVVTVAFST